MTRGADGRPPGDERQRSDAGVVGEAGDRAEGAEADRRQEYEARAEQPARGLSRAPRHSPRGTDRVLRLGCLDLGGQAALLGPKLVDPVAGGVVPLDEVANERAVGIDRWIGQPLGRLRQLPLRGREVRPRLVECRPQAARQPMAGVALLRLASLALRRGARGLRGRGASTTTPRGVARAPSTAPRVSMSTPRFAA